MTATINQATHSSCAIQAFDLWLKSRKQSWRKSYRDGDAQQFKEKRDTKRAKADEHFSTITPENASRVYESISRIFSTKSDGSRAPQSTRDYRWWSFKSRHQHHDGLKLLLDVQAGLAQRQKAQQAAQQAARQRQAEELQRAARQRQAEAQQRAARQLIKREAEKREQLEKQRIKREAEKREKQRMRKKEQQRAFRLAAIQRKRKHEENNFDHLFGTTESSTNQTMANNLFQIIGTKATKDTKLGIRIVRPDKKEEQGIKVTSISQNSPFANTQLRAGMFLKSINGVSFKSYEEGTALLKDRDCMQFTIWACDHT